jgi:hypothetical protein
MRPEGLGNFKKSPHRAIDSIKLQGCHGQVLQVINENDRWAWGHMHQGRSRQATTLNVLMNLLTKHAAAEKFSRGYSRVSELSIQVENVIEVTRSPAWVELNWVYLTAVSQFVLVSGSPLGPTIRFYPYPFFSGNRFVFLPVGRPLWREDGSVTNNAAAHWSGHWGPITIHYRLIWDCVPSSSPLTTRRGSGGGILTRFHTWYPMFKLKLKLIYDRQSVGQSVLVSGAHLGPVTNISFSAKFPSDSCMFVNL